MRSETLQHRNFYPKERRRGSLTSILCTDITGRELMVPWHGAGVMLTCSWMLRGGLITGSSRQYKHGGSPAGRTEAEGPSGWTRPRARPCNTRLWHIDGHLRGVGLHRVSAWGLQGRMPRRFTAWWVRLRSVPVHVDRATRRSSARGSGYAAFQCT